MPQMMESVPANLSTLPTRRVKMSVVRNRIGKKDVRNAVRSRNVYENKRSHCKLTSKNAQFWNSCGLFRGNFRLREANIAFLR